MAKIKSRDQLNDIINKDLANRKYEISFLIGLLHDKKSNRMAYVIAKSLIIVAYSHWEGFVKLTSARYLAYINFLSMPKSEMNVRLNAVGLAWLDDITRQPKCELINQVYDIITKDDYQLTFPVGPLVNPESNLNSEVLKKILADIGSDSIEFEDDYPFLDKKLLKYRNQYAHGESLHADIDDAMMIGNKVVELLNKYRDLVQNMIDTEQYRKVPVSPLS